MPDRSNVIYYYDGTYDGFMCCVFESVYQREIPVSIKLYGEEQATLYPVKEIYTDPEKAERVKVSIVKKISPEAKEIIEKSFLTNMKDKELHMLRFMLLGYKHGRKITEMLDNDEVDRVQKAVLFLGREAHLTLEFIRFSDYGGVLLSEITPRNNVLPLIASHFCSRFSGETFMIYDKTHKIALVHKDGERSFINVEHLEPPEAGPEEEHYRALWRKFYDTIGIEGRYNPQCRMNHMPKRYWKNMTEFQGRGAI